MRGTGQGWYNHTRKACSAIHVLILYIIEYAPITHTHTQYPDIFQFRIEIKENIQTPVGHRFGIFPYFSIRNIFRVMNSK